MPFLLFVLHAANLSSLYILINPSINLSFPLSVLIPLASQGKALSSEEQPLCYAALFTYRHTHTHTHTHAHPCCLPTWYRLCIETAPAEAVAVSVQLSESPHTHAHLHSLTHTYTHTYRTPLWWLVCCCMCRCNIIFRWEDFHVTVMVVITLLPCKYTLCLCKM